MTALIVPGSPTAAWVNLVSEGERACAVTLGEELQSYLVFLLMRYIGKADIDNTVLALDYLNSVQNRGWAKQTQLRDVGDKCLLFAGMFPKQAERRLVRISYFVNLGQSAYASLAHMPEFDLASLFNELSQQFVGLMDVLQAMRALAGDETKLSLLEAEALWRDTGSKQALACLRAATPSVWVESLDTRH